jgi:hypothetical protein
MTARAFGTGAVAAAAKTVASIRRARAAHPRGGTFHATVRTAGGAGCGVALLDEGGRYRALARFSRGLGLPEGWPDVLGIALRVYGGAGPDADLDLLVSTTLGRAPLIRHLPWPRRRWAVPYTTVAGYGTRQGRRYLALLPDPAAAHLGGDLATLAGAAASGQAAFRLAMAARRGDWRVLGRITVDEPVAPELDRTLAFDPVLRGAAELRTDGLLWRLRAAAYRGSRTGRSTALQRGASS